MKSSTELQSTPPPLSRGKRWAWLALAYASLAVGLLALVIPGIPTTEFILLSAWAANRSSPRLSAWLARHRVFGPMLHNWHNGRVVAHKAKLSASLAMSACLLVMLWTVPHRWVIVVAAIGMAIGACWMWSRPESVDEARARAPQAGQ
ncbi:DUF454 domain-containing protein [Pseudothauera nasutitermitis]|uniref:DUF454 domain-containing protein n=1 Tax=Pseudothauera nasutitermitis TaxID=2565930 RepID=A0A4S4B3N7_9RHOO|nr:YbaN family protein [Pseudothauera nasutitermitis]THF67239.1 DUF454 domain-containing protein [Pseudothauera nasutitermitis]